MARNDLTSAIIDQILKLTASGALLSTLILAPNAIQILDKPLEHLFKGLDERYREREMRRVLAYMKRQGLIRLTAEDYEHGIELTSKGKKRSQKADFERLQISQPKVWDTHWRLVIFDIPESHRSGRIALTRKLRALGFLPLQQSAWVHPYPCRKEIEIVSHHYDLSKYISYMEINYIDNQGKLIKRFENTFQ